MSLLSACIEGWRIVYSVRMKAARRITVFAVPLAAACLIALLGLTGVFQVMQGWTYDVLLSVRPSAPAANGVLLIDVDGPAEAAAGPWPWTRDVLARGLVALREMDARVVVLDLPLSQKSQPSLDPSALRRAFPDALGREFSQIEENIQNLFEGIRRGSIKPQDSPRYVTDLVGLVALAKIRLLDAATGIARDDDTLLGEAAAFFGDTFVALEPQSSADPAVDQDLADQAVQIVSLAVAAPGLDPSPTAAAVRPPVAPLLAAARGGGFAEIAPDADGVRRRALLVSRLGDKHLGQIAFSAALDFLGNPGVELHASNLSLLNVALSDTPPVTVVIPLTEQGRMLLEWPKARGDDGFRHLSWGELVRAEKLEEALVTTFKEMDRQGYLSYLRSETDLLDAYDYAGSLQSAATLDAWREARARFFSLADQFLGGDAEARIMADADKALRSRALSDDEKRAVLDERNRVPSMFSDARQAFRELEQERLMLEQAARGSLCIISLGDALAPANVARTPFGGRTTEASAGAALVSTILSGRFLREVPTRIVGLLAVIFCLLAAIAVYRLRPLATALLGLGLACFVVAALGALFVLRGVFPDPFVPGFSVVVSCLSL
jgi:adenylate cyclase